MKIVVTIEKALVANVPTSDQNAPFANRYKNGDDLILSIILFLIRNVSHREVAYIREYLRNLSRNINAYYTPTYN